MLKCDTRMPDTWTDRREGGNSGLDWAMPVSKCVVKIFSVDLFTSKQPKGTIQYFWNKQVYTFIASKSNESLAAFKNLYN